MIVTFYFAVFEENFWTGLDIQRSITFSLGLFFFFLIKLIFLVIDLMGFPPSLLQDLTQLVGLVIDSR